jgi:hypothetical protein
MASRDNDLQQQPGQLKNALYLQPKVNAGVHAPKAAKKYAQAQAAAQLVRVLYLHILCKDASRG